MRIVNFNDVISEGYVFLAYQQRISDLLNDDREFLPIETEAGEVKVIAKRAIMELEVLQVADDSKPAAGDTVISLLSGNAYDILGAAQDSDDATIRALYLDKLNSISDERLGGASDNPDLQRACDGLRQRYEAAYDAITSNKQIEAIAEAIKASQPKRRRFGDA